MKIDSSVEREVLVDEFASSLKADVILYSGAITSAGADKIFKETASPLNKNVCLILSTHGGEPGAAYRIARRLQDKYEKFVLYVYGHCKSAGTLIAIGSDEILMGDLAEFGPLDVQITDGEEIGRLSSGLNVFSAISALQEQSYDYFIASLLDLVSRCRLSTRNATTIATKLTEGFFAPVLSNIDPVKVGELERAVKIAVKYGEILSERGNISAENLSRLVTDFPDHGYVIDFKQAAKLFNQVRKTKGLEIQVGEQYHSVLRYPSKELTISRLNKDNAHGRDQTKQANGKRTPAAKKRTARANGSVVSGVE